jgi:hypothetical protein
MVTNAANHEAMQRAVIDVYEAGISHRLDRDLATRSTPNPNIFAGSAISATTFWGVVS